jgi:hypothetical protein
MSARPSSSSVGQKRSPSILPRPKLAGFRKLVAPCPRSASRVRRKAWAVGAWRVDNLIRLSQKIAPKLFLIGRALFQIPYRALNANHGRGHLRF